MMRNINANRISKTKKAHGIFSVSRTKRLLQNGQYADRISDRAAVTLAAALDYLILEIIEIAARVCEHHDRSRITPRHIALAVHNDYDMSELLKNVTIAKGGVRQFIHPRIISQPNQRDDDTGGSSSAD